MEPTTRLEKRGSQSQSGSSGDDVSLSSLEKRRRLVNSNGSPVASGKTLKQARAAFASGTKETKSSWTPRRQNSGGSLRSKKKAVAAGAAKAKEEEETQEKIPREVVHKDDDAEDDIPALTEDGIIEPLLMEELQREDAKAVARALEQLGSIFKHEDPSHCRRAVDLGGPSRLLVCLKKWKGDARVARHGCHAIFRMIGTYTKNYSTIDLVESFLQLGGADVLLQVLRQFPQACEVQLFGMGALGNLFRGRCRPAALKLVQEGGVSVIVQAMNQFPHHAKMQEFGCWLCARLCFSLGSVQSQLVMKEEALVAVATAVQNHPIHSSIEKQAGNFMATLFNIRGSPTPNHATVATKKR